MHAVDDYVKGRAFYELFCGALRRRIGVEAHFRPESQIQALVRRSGLEPLNRRGVKLRVGLFPIGRRAVFSSSASKSTWSVTAR